KIAAPLIVSYACDTIMMFTDRLFLSKLSGAHMSAAMSGGLTAFMLSTFFVGLIGYTTAMVAQRLGAEKKERCAVITTQGLIIAFAAYPVLLALIPLGKIIFAESGIDASQLDLQVGYFRILMYGSLIPLIRSSLGNFFSGIGRTRLVMLAAVISMVTNVGLNYMLIFGKFGMPALGIRGAAIGTIAAGFVGIVVLFLAYLRKSNREEFGVSSSFIFDKPLMKELWRLGMPSGAELFLNLLAFTAMITIFHGQGIVVASSVTITFNWDMVAFIPLLGINVGVTTLVGQYVGKKDLATANNAMKSGLLLACSYVIGLMILFVVSPGPLVELFKPEQHSAYWAQIYPLAVAMVELISVYLLADAVTIVFSGALRGAGDTFWTMVLSVAIHWGLAILTLLCFYVFNQNAYTTWVAVICVFCVLASAYMLRYYKGNWQEKALALEA
ncbi:MAG: MATE family efflux transporter, partial [Deltaproteobacteria bacterium]|nr:MATE family efflux transporter [Deltaproteobacteria bacterium]